MYIYTHCLEVKTSGMKQFNAVWLDGKLFLFLNEFCLARYINEEICSYVIAINMVNYQMYIMSLPVCFLLAYANCMRSVFG